ncbi:MAG: cytochrome c [Aureispira sp.]|nr:cytochrome c [Aureispira sp.]
MRKNIFIFQLLLAFLFGTSSGVFAQDPAGITGNADMGRKLFAGMEHFQNGGVSCLSCHNVGGQKIPAGGLMAKDLTNAFSRMGGEAGIGGILGAPPFPAMTYSYKYNPITEQEIADIAAFLKQADAANPDYIPATIDDGFKTMLLGGGLGLVVFFALIHMLWGNRKRSKVKADILAR